MIKNIIKRDGRVEPYIAKKINSWGKWASKDIVNWSKIVIDTVSFFDGDIRSSDLQEKLIQNCLNEELWPYYKMAGRLYASHLYKIIYNGKIPHLKDIHKKLIEENLLEKLPYSEADYEVLNEVMNHDLDFETPHFSLHYIRKKYSLHNRVTGKEFETQQFVYMRMAMAIFQNEKEDKRLELVKNLYHNFSLKKISAPTPNFVNLGTKHHGFASCCLYVADDNEPSLAIGDHIAYRMTAASAGIGSFLMTRSKGDPVRSGLVEHQGKLPYFASLGKAVQANMQTGRGGACTTYYSAYDPEAEVIAYLRNPRSTENRKNRDLHYALLTNRFFAKKVARNEMAFSFNIKTAPKLFEYLFCGKEELFTSEYNRLEEDPTFKKNYFNPRDLLLIALNEALETGVAYLVNTDEMNSHTPFLEKIHSSNLCLEIAEPNNPYQDMRDLYSSEEVGFVSFLTSLGDKKTFSFNEKIKKTNGEISFMGAIKEGESFCIKDELINCKKILSCKIEPEVALCSLGAIAIDEINSDEEYEEAMYLSLKMIDYCIENTHYVLPHVGVSAKKRMNAGVGMMGLATYLAKRKLSYKTQEGLQEVHFISERHMYMAIKASLRIAKERGVAPWIHKTKWPNGWLPIDSYNKNIDSLGDFKLSYNWEGLREEIKKMGGIAHSCLVAYMPGESSSKALGKTNSIYPIRNEVLNKTDSSITIRWAAPDSHELNYESAWGISEIQMLKVYGIIQKFTDQAISADLWRSIKDDDHVGSRELLSHYFTMIKYGVKTRYYYNSNVASDKSINVSGSIGDNNDICEGCTL